MRCLRWLGAASLILTLTASEAAAAAKPAVGQDRPTGPRRAAKTIDNTTHMDVNNIDMVVTNHGSFAYDLVTGNAGFIYPKGSTHTAVFAAGPWIGAKVGGSVRIAVGEYSQEFVPGPMANGTFQTDNPRFKNYKIVRGNTTSFDYLNWPADMGAPVDSTGRPALLGDAMIWSVYNDADPSVHNNDAGFTAPLGVEIQQTTFAFNRAGALGNIIFVRYKMINKGGNTLDSMFISAWSDPDLGGFTDDLVGCDTTRSLGYIYNATNGDAQYGSRPPAVGYDFFRGPIVPTGTPGVFDTLGMTSFNKYINGTDPHSSQETYNYMLGLKPDGSPVHVNDDPLQPITKFQVPGDPVTSTGWLDSNPADRRLMLSTGPFTMAPGDSQEVTIAIIVGQGTDRLSSISDMKSKDDVAQVVFNLNFDICAPPPSPTVYVQPLNKGIRLVWGSEPAGFECINTALNQDFKFEGIRVWQMSSNSADATPTVVATFDNPDGVTNIYSDEFNSTSGAVQRELKVNATDSGLQFSLDITSDKIRGGNLINNKEYYFAVTAYAYDANNAPSYTVGGVPLGIVSEVLESARNPIRAAPKTSSAVFSLAATPVATGPLNPSGTVDVDQLVQSQITGHDYIVKLNNLEQWTLIDASAGDTLLVNQANVSGDFENPVVDGIMVRPTAPRGVAGIGELRADSTLTNMTPPSTDSTGTWHFNDFGGLGGFTPFFGHPKNHDYEIRVLADTTNFAWTYGSGEVSFVQTFKVPFEVWDLGFNSLNDPSDDVKMSIMARDRDLSGDWSQGDRFYIRNIPYALVDWDTTGGAPNPVTKSTDYVPDGSDQTLGNFQPAYNNPLYTLGWPPQTTIRVLAGRFTSADQYTFRTVKAGTAPGTVVGNDVNKIRAVPNPYYAHSQYELTQFDRVMKFTNIPASRRVTLRIFNLAGDLVRTITREATTSDQMANAEIQWNLNTDRNLPVASGVYIYRIEVEGVGAKTDRLAVFIEKERLDNF
ncbi:MAG: hypothetical protein E6K76_04490 [Candidatus Eisenbacteria bacterium]|uniref:T9SS type A sorting domain-containing protein n=1 Tax=Eiseniibacteriota bacterium TaxID=2212470 RepID=A0A538T7B0_UNCEI|nr:MAG: hypothetical protein E6K76_04490 [Candidatus Eisenbacteria bacterium]